MSIVELYEMLYGVSSLTRFRVYKSYRVGKCFLYETLYDGSFDSMDGHLKQAKVDHYSYELPDMLFVYL